MGASQVNGFICMYKHQFSEGITWNGSILLSAWGCRPISCSNHYMHWRVNHQLKIHRAFTPYLKFPESNYPKASSTITSRHHWPLKSTMPRSTTQNAKLQHLTKHFTCTRVFFGPSQSECEYSAWIISHYSDPQVCAWQESSWPEMGHPQVARGRTSAWQGWLACGVSLLELNLWHSYLPACILVWCSWVSAQLPSCYAGFAVVNFWKLHPALPIRDHCCGCSCCCGHGERAVRPWKHPQKPPWWDWCLPSSWGNWLPGCDECLPLGTACPIGSWWTPSGQPLRRMRCLRWL